MKYSFWNLENFFFLLDQDNYTLEDLKSMNINDFRKMTYGINPNKDIEKIEEIHNKIKELDSDFIGCSEMGGRESMHNFKKYYLISTVGSLSNSSCICSIMGPISSSVSVRSEA